jgi:hypothetical protein
MELPGWSTVAGVIAKIVNNFIPSKKAALVDELNALNVKYQEVLSSGKDTEAATIRKQMQEIRKKVGFADDEL